MEYSVVLKGTNKGSWGTLENLCRFPGYTIITFEGSLKGSLIFWNLFECWRARFPYAGQRRTLLALFSKSLQVYVISWIRFGNAKFKLAFLIRSGLGLVSIGCFFVACALVHPWPDQIMVEVTAQLHNNTTIQPPINYSLSQTSCLYNNLRKRPVN